MLKKFFRNKLVLVPGTPFHPSIVFVYKAGEYQSRAHFGCSTSG